MMDDLEFLREVFKDVRVHVAVGVLTQLDMAKDASCYYVKVNLLPEQREVIAQMSFADVWDVTFPQANDLVLVAFATETHPEEAFVIARLHASDQKIPQFARAGHSVRYSRPGKKLYLGSDTKLGIGRVNVEPTEPLVLGNVLVTFMTNVLNAFLDAAQIGTCAVGPVMLDPGIRTNLTNYIQTYLQTASSNIISQIAFTERGA
jgi:hypothetical protein